MIRLGRRCPILEDVRARTLLAGVLLGLCACDDQTVVAKVGSTRLRQQDVDAFAAQRDARASRKQVLADLVDSARLAEAGSRAGLRDRPELRARLAAAEREILAAAFLEQRVGGEASEASLRKAYEERKDKLGRRELHLQQVFVAVPPDADERRRHEATAKANLAYARAVAGEDFAALARELSEDSASAARGGDLGPVLEGQVDARFFAAAAALKAGEISRPIVTAYGQHVIRASAAPEIVTPSFEDARATLAATLRREAEAEVRSEVARDIPAELHPERLKAEPSAVKDSGAPGTGGGSGTRALMAGGSR